MRRTKLKFGWRIPSFPVDGTRGASFIKQITSFLDKFKDDFSSAWLSDHLVPWLETQPRDTDTLECFTTLTYLSALYPNLDFGSIVLCNSYRHPPLLSKMASTFQTLTDGRLILGIGAGWMEEEYHSHGYPFPSSKLRIEQMEEAVKIIRDMLTRGVATIKGRYYRVDDAYCYPKSKPPPIMIGGGGEQMTLKVAARHADWWNIPNASLETYKRKLEILKRYCREEGRNPEEIVKTLATFISIAPSDEEAEKNLTQSPLYNHRDRGGYISGSPGRVCDRILEYADLGVEHFILRFLDFPKLDGATLFFKEVTPNLQ